MWPGADTMRPMSRGHNKLAFATPKPINIAALQLAAAMRQENITKGEMAKRLKTSHAQVNRILDPKHNPSLSSLSRAATIVGLRVSVELT